MNIGSPLSSAILGLRSAVNRFNDHGAQVAQARTPGAALQPLIETRIDRLHVAANANVVRAADDNLGKLLDVVA